MRARRQNEAELRVADPGMTSPVAGLSYIYNLQLSMQRIVLSNLARAAPLF